MERKLKVVIVVAQCSKTKNLYGMRFEEASPNNWLVNWAFPIKQKTAKHEGYTENKIRGSFNFTEEFPGCPYCEAEASFVCDNCQTIACYDGKAAEVTCPGCNSRAKISGVAEQVNSNRDR